MNPPGRIRRWDPDLGALALHVLLMTYRYDRSFVLHVELETRRARWGGSLTSWLDGRHRRWRWSCYRDVFRAGGPSEVRHRETARVVEETARRQAIDSRLHRAISECSK